MVGSRGKGVVGSRGRGWWSQGVGGGGVKG